MSFDFFLPFLISLSVSCVGIDIESLAFSASSKLFFARSDSITKFRVIEDVAMINRLLLSGQFIIFLINVK